MCDKNRHVSPSVSRDSQSDLLAQLIRALAAQSDVHSCVQEVRGSKLLYSLVIYCRPIVWVPRQEVDLFRDTGLNNVSKTVKRRYCLADDMQGKEGTNNFSELKNKSFNQHTYKITITM